MRSFWSAVAVGPPFAFVPGAAGNAPEENTFPTAYQSYGQVFTLNVKVLPLHALRCVRRAATYGDHLRPRPLLPTPEDGACVYSWERLSAN